MLCPNRSAAEVAEFAAAPAVTVSGNFPAIQAARRAPLGITAANFWNDGGAADGGITVDRIASVAVQNDGVGFLDVAVSDPTQANTGTIRVELDWAAISTVSADPGITVAQLAPALRLTIEVNVAGGKSFRARFAKSQTKPPASLANLSTRHYMRRGPGHGADRRRSLRGALGAAGGVASFGAIHHIRIID